MTYHTLTHRHRDRSTSVSYNEGIEEHYRVPSGAFVSKGTHGSKGNKKYVGTQNTASEGHRKGHNGFYDEGGPFYTAKAEIVSKFLDVNLKTSNLVFEGTQRKVDSYSGPIFLPMSVDEDWAKQLKSIRSEDTSDLDRKGAEAISLCSPVSPSTELGTGLAELYRDGIPSIPGAALLEDAVRPFIGVADEFLNTVFGWEPIKREATSFLATVRNVGSILKQYEENAGSNLHREFKFPIEEDEASSYFAPASATTGGFKLSTWEVPSLISSPFVIRKTKTRLYFKGCFTYTVPSQSDAWQRLLYRYNQANELFGLDITPQMIWELTPWSWAIDWFADVKSVLTNLNSFTSAGQVMRYGYMMEEKSIENIYGMATSGIEINGWVCPPPNDLVGLVTTKVRRPANPYGFGISVPSLSLEQIAICAALGITLL